MPHRQTQAAPRDRVPFTLWGQSRIRTILAGVAASAAGLVPAILISSPAMASANDITIADATTTEGGDLVFTITREHDAGADLTSQVLTWSTANGTATAGSDYTAVSSGSVTLPAWTNRSTDQTATITVHTAIDAVSDDGETLTVTVAGSGATITDDTATGTITDGPSYALTASASSVSETATVVNNSPVYKTVTVRATLTEAAGSQVQIPIDTVDGTANSTAGTTNRDFTAVSGGHITIAAGETSGTATITINDDPLDEDASQYFDVVGGVGDNGSDALSGAGRVRINILDDDATPSVTIGDAGTAAEGSPLVFPLALSGKSEKAVTVKVNTANGVDSGDSYGAIGGTDFTALTNSTVTFPATTTSALAIVATTDDSVVESSPETMSAQLSSPTNATLGATTTGTGGINDNETAPTATITPTTLAEGTGETARTLTVTLSNPSSSTIPVKINYTFADGTATNGTDFRGVAGSVTIAPGDHTATIPVSTIGDSVYEPSNETFDVVMSSPNASIANSGGGLTQSITITDDDSAPTWTVGDTSVTEGNSGTSTARIPVILSGPINSDTDFTLSGGALSGGTLTETGTNAATGTDAGKDDYDLPNSTTVTIPAGSTTAYLNVTVKGDATFENSETATATFTTASGNVSGTIPTGSQHAATFTITNDDAAPRMTFNEAAGSEGTSLRVIGTLAGVSQYPYDLAITYPAIGGTSATPVVDYDTTGATTVVNVTRGQTGALPALANVYLNPDDIDEATETFGVTATETTAGGLTGFVTSTGTYRINDDPNDLPPAASISDETIDEDEGSVDVHVTLAFSGDTTSTSQTVSVPYYTQDGAAKAGHDYTSTTGTLTFTPGQLSKVINVPITDDATGEDGEDFFVKLGTPSPSGTTVADSTGEVLINENDGGAGATAPSISVEDTTIRGAQAIDITGTAVADSTVELWAAPISEDSLVKVGETTADEDGAYSFHRWIGQGYRFQTKVDGEGSDVVTVRIIQAPIFVPGTTKGKLTLAVKGSPAGGGQTVIVQRLVSGKWVNTWRGTTSDDDMVWRASSKQKSGTSLTLRAFIVGDLENGIYPGYSSARKVTIK